MKENYLSGKPRPRELQWFEVTYIRNAGTRQAKSEQGCNTLLKHPRTISVSFRAGVGHYAGVEQKVYKAKRS